LACARMCAGGGWGFRGVRPFKLTSCESPGRAGKREPADIARGSAFPGVILGISRGLCRLSPKGGGAACGSQSFGNARVSGASVSPGRRPRERLPLTC
jgi:hypothetical protein